MYLLEHDAKVILAARGVPVPPGRLFEGEAPVDLDGLGPGPWMVKAQLPLGGRGKAGLVRPAGTPGEAAGLVAAMIGREHRGRVVGGCRVEACADFAHEAYLAFMPAPETGGVRVLVSAAGGIDVEAAGSVHSAVVSPDAQAMADAVASLAARAGDAVGPALVAAAAVLARAFLEHDAVLLEINPLFVTADGGWLAGDAKMVVDDNALYRQPEVAALLEARGHAYPETFVKWKHGCDYVVVDPQGSLGLLTTGAGLSMMLIDELRAAGLAPYNFLDVRTGGLRGDPTRLINVLEWIARGPEVRCILVNVFAGITHLGEFSRLLVEALERVPTRGIPVVTRLVGNGLDEAREVLGAAGIAVEPDLDRALALVRAALERP